MPTIADFHSVSRSDTAGGGSVTRLACLLLLFTLAIPCSTAAAEVGRPYIMGVFPHLPPRELEKVYAPMVADLGRSLGREVQFRSSSRYERFMQRLENQAFDIVFVQPFDYVHVADRFGYLPLATRNEPLETLFVVKQDSPLQGLESLRGRHIAYPPAVAAVSRLGMAYLHEQGLEVGKDVQISYHRSHVSCLQQVLIGAADACGTAAPALRFFEHKMDVQLKVVAKSQAIPHTLFAVSPRVPQAERAILLRTILSWGDSEAGRAMLKRGRLREFIPISDSAYDGVRKFRRSP